MVDINPTGRRLDHRASWTAQVCAAQRAAETLRSPGRRRLEDPYARRFVGHPLLRASLSNPLTARAFIAAIEHRSPGLHSFVALRVRHVDDVCRTAMGNGVDQIVLLGAGFDTTSRRLDGRSVTIFEVDAPTTQSDKRLIADALPPHSAVTKIIWVPCDFEHDALRERLLDGGFDPARPSVIAWIGVTMFLTHDAIAATLADLTALCAPGSRLVFDHIDADVATGQSCSKSARRAARSVARRGEPYRTGFKQPEIESLAATHGFVCREHLRSADLTQRYAPTQTNGAADDDWLTITTVERI